MTPEVRPTTRRFVALAVVAAGVLAGLLLASTATSSGEAARVSQVHYGYRNARTVVFDWVGEATDLRYGPTARYGTTLTAVAPTPMPFSSPGPFREVVVSGLKAGATYHYSIGGGPDATFSTPPRGAYRFAVEADVGATPETTLVQGAIAADRPAFVLLAGDLTYANDRGQEYVDRHFDAVMAWSRRAAYVPAWGNHDWKHPGDDDLRNYKGRLVMPNGRASSSAPPEGCCGDDWGWFDAGGVRFISYPEPYSDETWDEWAIGAAGIMASAERDRRIHFVVTFGHRPAYSSGYHDGEGKLARVIGTLGREFPKYVLNLNGHSHNYERFKAIDGVVHVTTGAGGASPQELQSDPLSETVFRLQHLSYLRVDVTASAMRVQAVCGPATDKDASSCVAGRVVDSVTFTAGAPRS